jgi:hypothetical protein
MALDYLYLGPTPADEDCAQVGQDNFRKQAEKEMKAYINQLSRMFPEHDENGVGFRIKWQSHDFGTYGEVVAYYDDSIEESYEYALKIEWNLPDKWDDEALEELENN